MSVLEKLYKKTKESLFVNTIGVEKEIDRNIMCTLLYQKYRVKIEDGVDL